MPNYLYTTDQFAALDLARATRVTRWIVISTRGNSYHVKRRNQETTYSPDTLLNAGMRDLAAFADLLRYFLARKRPDRRDAVVLNSPIPLTQPRTKELNHG